MPIRRLAERAQHELDQLYAVLDAAWVGTLSVFAPGGPATPGSVMTSGGDDGALTDTTSAAALPRVQSIPILYGRDGDSILFHGSTGAGTLRALADGALATFCVSILDGFVYAASLFESSANYRSAVLSGPVEVLTGSAAEQAVVTLSERVMPGRPAEVRHSTRKEYAATTVLRMPIATAEWTVKARTGGPGPEPDEDPSIWRGVLPVRTVFGEPEAAPEQHGIPLPGSIVQRLESGR